MAIDSHRYDAPAPPPPVSGLARRLHAPAPPPLPFGSAGPRPGYAPVTHPQAQPTHHLTGARVPTIWPVITFSLMFGFLAVVSAANRARRARQVGAPERPYWLAFAATNIIGMVLGFTVAVLSNLDALKATL